MDLSSIKISGAQPDFIRLILRSPDRGDGWRSVSRALEAFAKDMVSRRPELYETEDRGGLMLRLSERGNVLGDYL